MIERSLAVAPSPVRVESSRYVAGYLPAMRQPALTVTLRIKPGTADPDMLERFDSVVHHHLPGYHAETADADPVSLCRRLAAAAGALLYAAGMPVFSQATFAKQDGDRFEIALPVIHDEAAGSVVEAFEWICTLFGAAALQTAENDFSRLFEKLKRSAPGGVNTIRLLEAADRRDIPWHYLANGIFQLGWGSRSRLFNSTLSDATSMIAVAASGNKMATARMLREAGLPVPEHAEAHDQLHALGIAERLGYPVVIKPLALAQGKGVAAGLKTREAVKKAYKKASVFSRRILVERHFEGNDYRIHVCNGALYYASQRIPGGVTGDGEQTVEALLALLNAEPDRQILGNRQKYKQIPMDEEALDLLGEQQMTPQSIPAEGTFVRLRRTANVSTGGTHSQFEDLNEIHADNRRLAVRAAAALRLDIAAVDFLSPDIRRSWMDTGGVICEVNAQPQVRHVSLFDHLVKTLVKGDGRVPVIPVLGTGPETPWLSDLARTLSAQGRRIGIASKHLVSIGGETVSTLAENAYEGGRVLMNDTAVDIAFLCIPEKGMLCSGLPVDRFDAMIISAPDARTESGTAPAEWIRIARGLLPLCAGPFILEEKIAHCRDAEDLPDTDGITILPSAKICRYVQKHLDSRGL